MKYVKTPGLPVCVAAALMALAGAGAATASVLCKNNGSTSICSENYPSGTEIKSSLSTGTKAVLKTEFKTVECSKSTVAGKPENGGDATESIKGSVEALTFEECNCEVKVLKKGTLEIHWISGSNNGTVTENGAEVTVNCSTIFGTVHCFYVTEKTDLGILSGGNPAKLSAKATIPHLTTSGLCSATASWEATYEATSPKPLYVDELDDLTLKPDPLEFAEVKVGKVVKITNSSGVTIKNIGVGLDPKEGFEMAKVCNNVTLEKGKSCEESIQCLKKGIEGHFSVASFDPIVVLNSTTLEC
ncbi:MAG TPA: hypothetical protein VFJ65_12150 [Solirubrobacterales bacterium]|nr:hypothetical protein [Solirubrobacterales bacterium]